MKKYLLGTTIKITDIIDVDTADSAFITIEDSGNTEKISEAPMIKEADRIYYYIYKSSKTDQAGKYVARATITIDGNPGVKEYEFEMIDQSDQ